MRPDGSVVWVLDLMETLYDDAGPAYQQGFLIDVTERKENESLFRAVFDNAGAAMVIVDDNARNVDVNPSACELFGRSRDELLGKRIGDLSAELAEAGGVWRGSLPPARPRDRSRSSSRAGRSARPSMRRAQTCSRTPSRGAPRRDRAQNLELELWRAQRLERRPPGGGSPDFNNNC